MKQEDDLFGAPSPAGEDDLFGVPTPAAEDKDDLFAPPAIPSVDSDEDLFGDPTSADDAADDLFDAAQPIAEDDLFGYDQLKRGATTPVISRSMPNWRKSTKTTCDCSSQTAITARYRCALVRTGSLVRRAGR